MCLVCVVMLKFWISISFLGIFSVVTPSPYLFSAPRALAGLATSASASASDQKPAALTNIADLRRKEQKSAQLQAEKDPSIDDAITLQGNSSEDTTNEASPGIIHKKVSKILAKLQLITQFKNAVHRDNEKNEEIKRNDEQFEKELAEFDRELEEDTKKEDLQESEHIQTLKKDSSAENETGYTYSPKDGPELLYLNFEEKRDVPNEKVNIELEEKIEKRSEKQVNGRFGDIGVFFAELVGTLMALAYGAAIQITGNGGQSNV